jgi:hypothetical protein
MPQHQNIVIENVYCVVLSFVVFEQLLIVRVRYLAVSKFYESFEDFHLENKPGTITVIVEEQY